MKCVFCKKETAFCDPELERALCIDCYTKLQAIRNGNPIIHNHFHATPSEPQITYYPDVTYEDDAVYKTPETTGG